MKELPMCKGHDWGGEHWQAGVEWRVCRRCDAIAARRNDLGQRVGCWVIAGRVGSHFERAQEAAKSAPQAALGTTPLFGGSQT